MTVNIGGSAVSHGPGGTLHRFGSKEGEGRISGRVLWQLLRFVRPYRVRMYTAALLMFLTSLANLLVPYLTKVAIDEDIAAGDLHGLTVTCLELSGVLLVVYLSSAGQRYLLSWVGQKVLATLRGQLFRHLQDLSIAYHDTHIIGVTISRVINDVAVINDLLSQGIVSLLGDGVMLVGTVIAMMAMEPRLALLTFSVLPLMALATALFSRHARLAFR